MINYEIIIIEDSTVTGLYRYQNFWVKFWQPLKTLHFDDVKHNNYIQFNKSYKMAVFFKSNNADFPPLPLSLPFATACNSLSTNVSLSSKHLSNSTKNFFLWFLLFHVVSLFLAKSFVSDLIFNVSAKSNHLVYNSVMFLEPLPVKVSFAPAHVYQCVNLVESVFCHLLVSSLGKPVFIYLNTVRSLNVCL